MAKILQFSGVLFLLLTGTVKLNASVQQGTSGKNDLLFYRLEKDGKYTLVSDTSNQIAETSEFKVSKEENYEIYFSYKGSAIAKAIYNGEMTKLKLEVGKVQLPHGQGVLTNGADFSYEGQWQAGNMHGVGVLKAEGFVYSGGLEKNAIHGKGKLIEANKDEYDGGWAQGKKHGEGELQFSVAESKIRGRKKGIWSDGLFTGDATLPIGSEGYYIGKIVNDKKQGEGEMKYKTGSVYKGTWENDNKAGQGKYLWPDGDYYEGMWKNDKINGAGTMVLKGRSTWKCNWKDGEPIDSGEVIYDKGARYKGGVGIRKDGDKSYYCFEGYGRYYIKFISEDTSVLNDSSYAGMYKGGLAHGKGKMVRNGNGEMSPIKLTIYEGDWQNNKKNGIGREELQNFMGGKIIYDGGWQNDQRHGKGIQTIDEGLQRVTTKGNWESGVLIGYVEEDADYGPMGSEEHSVFKGNYTNGVKNGKGTEISAEGTYDGNWVDGSKSGLGKMMYKDGRIYEGQRQDGQPNGKGAMFLADKTVQKGVFVNGEFQKPYACKSVTIGSQDWMLENLNVDKFRNGDEIPHAKTDAEWEIAGKTGQPAWCYYNNDPGNGAKYGKLYNWYAVNDTRGLAPVGWHISSDDEWKQLTNFLGGEEQAGLKMKTTSGWNNNGNGTNISGFSALPGGFRHSNGTFLSLGDNSFLWSSSQLSAGKAWDRALYSPPYDNKSVGRHDSNEGGGFTVRCLKD
jgi:uncharacterized protein (TIGR02145 family)